MITMIKWIRTSRLSINNSLTTPGRPFDANNCGWKCSPGYGVVSGMECTRLVIEDVAAVYITFGLDVTLGEFDAVRPRTPTT